MGLALLALFGLVGCSLSTEPEPDRLAEARALWASQGSSSYRYEVTRGCYCVLGGEPLTVTVRNGSVESAQSQTTGQAVDGTLLTYVPTVPDLFDLIEDALRRNPPRFAVGYDPGLGYPTLIDIDYIPNAIDDELRITARSLALLPPFAPVVR